MMKTKYIDFLGYIFIFVFNVLVPQFQTEHYVVCGKESSELQCRKNRTIDIHYVYWYSWQSKCISAQESNCHVGTDLIKKHCNIKSKCILEENDLNSCSTKSRHVDVKYYCEGWWPYSKKYLYHVQVCGSLSEIYCSHPYAISEIVVLAFEIIDACEIESDVKKCIYDAVKRCIGYHRCSYNQLINEKCFHLPLKSDITYSCNTKGTGLHTTTVKNNGNQGIIPTADVPQRTIVVDITKPPKSDEVEWILDLDKDSRLLIINQKRNFTYSLCANNWTNEHAIMVCRHLKRSENGIAGDIPRNKNLERIAFGLNCPVNITNPFECKPDNTNASREICNLSGDASVTCKNDTDSHLSDKTGLTGIIVGGILGFIFALVIIVVFIICRRKRNKKEKRAGDEKRENASTTANYHRENDMHDTGEQERVSLIIPTTPEAATQLDGGQYFVLDPGATGFNRSNKKYSDKDNENEYTISSDGVYDVTNERRHIEKDEINIYSHTVDDVYDTSAHDRRGKERDNAYDDCVIQNDG